MVYSHEVSYFTKINIPFRKYNINYDLFIFIQINVYLVINW